MTTAARTPYALHWWRIGIRIPATLFVAIALILSIVVGSNCHNRDGFDDYLDCYPWLTFPFIILALVWDAAEYITLCVNKKGIHPGAHIALNFIVFAGLISGGPIDIIVGLDEYDYSHPALGGEGVLAVLAAILYLVLFILACIAVHKWRRARYPKNMMAMQQPYYPAMMPIAAGQYATVPVQASMPPAPPGMMYQLVQAPQQQQFAAQEQHQQQQNRSVAPEQVQQPQHPSGQIQPQVEIPAGLEAVSTASDTPELMAHH